MRSKPSQNDFCLWARIGLSSSFYPVLILSQLLESLITLEWGALNISSDISLASGDLILLTWYIIKVTGHVSPSQVYFSKNSFEFLLLYFKGQLVEHRSGRECRGGKRAWSWVWRSTLYVDCRFWHSFFHHSLLPNSEYFLVWAV